MWSFQAPFTWAKSTSDYHVQCVLAGGIGLVVSVPCLILRRSLFESCWRLLSFFLPINGLIRKGASKASISLRGWVCHASDSIILVVGSLQPQNCQNLIWWGYILSVNRMLTPDLIFNIGSEICWNLIPFSIVVFPSERRSRIRYLGTRGSRIAEKSKGHNLSTSPQRQIL